MDNPSSFMLSRRVNFEFAFNNADFSDRVLHLKIKSDSGVFVEVKTLHISSVLLAANSPFFRKLFENGMRESKQRNATLSINASGVMKLLKFKTLHICSLLLAGNIPFFHKLFDNGMRESKQRDATLSINTSEEVGVMEVLNFMYSNTLKATSFPDLLGVLVVADKFDVTDCVSYCCESLKKMPMSLESAVMYLELPASVLVSELVQPLINAAKKFIRSHFKDFKNSKEEAMTLPLPAVEVLLRSLRGDLLGDFLFKFILKWARAHYPDLNERREVLTKNLTRFIPFRHMSSLKLKQVLVCPDFDHENVSKLMLEALILMVEDSHDQKFSASNKYPIAKVDQYGTLYSRKEDCESLSLLSRLYSWLFGPGGRTGEQVIIQQCAVLEKSQRITQLSFLV